VLYSTPKTIEDVAKGVEKIANELHGLQETNSLGRGGLSVVVRDGLRIEAESAAYLAFRNSGLNSPDAREAVPESSPQAALASQTRRA
jgi:hypothetical protein